jgi:hypothetical protein
MQHSKRKFVIQCLSLPLAACSIYRLQNVKTLSIVPPAQPSFRPAQIGQSWKYQKLNVFNSDVVDVFTERISEISASGVRINRSSITGRSLGDEIQAPWGQLSRDPYWDYQQNFNQTIPLFLDLGQQNFGANHSLWYQPNESSSKYWMTIYMYQRSWERVTLPIGTFDTIKIEKRIRLQHPDFTRLDTTRFDQYWFCPEIGRWVIRETSGRYIDSNSRGFMRSDLNEDSFRYELLSWV